MQLYGRFTILFVNLQEGLLTFAQLSQLSDHVDTIVEFCKAADMDLPNIREYLDKAQHTRFQHQDLNLVLRWLHKHHFSGTNELIAAYGQALGDGKTVAEAQIVVNELQQKLSLHPNVMQRLTFFVTKNSELFDAIVRNKGFGGKKVTTQVSHTNFYLLWDVGCLQQVDLKDVEAIVNNAIGLLEKLVNDEQFRLSELRTVGILMKQKNFKSEIEIV